MATISGQFTSGQWIEPLRRLSAGSYETMDGRYAIVKQSPDMVRGTGYSPYWVVYDQRDVYRAFETKTLQEARFNLIDMRESDNRLHYS